jgi:hypothetical protein
MLPSTAYIPGSQPDKMAPLGRYLPPIPEGVISQWLDENFPTQDNEPHTGWILDPFGASPNTAIEAARAGYRVLVAANNPITRFLIEMAANPPSKLELKAVLAELAGAKKGEERLEPHIKSLYRTSCDQCGQEVIADAFLWEKQAEGQHPTLFARQYTCIHCGKNGEFSATKADIELASQFSSTGLHFARALERVAQKDDPYRDNAIEALSAYLPRAVYALFTLINKVDNLPIPPNKQRLLFALLLTACDYGSTLWPYPVARSRPHQLLMPSRFREHNIWAALEEGLDIWAKEENDTKPPLQIHIWPDIDFSPAGICIFEGRFKDLAENLAKLSIQAIVSAIPRPNQPFWTLSALWSGWLWGKEGVGPFKNVLRRRRYDWSWHRYAIQATLESLYTMMRPETPFLGMIGEVEPGFLTALFSAAYNAGLYLTGIALRYESGQVQAIFRKSESIQRLEFPSEPGNSQLSFNAISKDNYQEMMSKPAREYLRLRGEPSPFLPVQAAILSYLSHKRLMQFPSPDISKETNAPSVESSQPSHEELSHIHHMVEQTLSYRNGFLRFGGSEKSIEVGSWWFREQKMPEDFEIEPPQTDRVEISVVRYLQSHSISTIQEIDQALCRSFPGLLTPSPELIQICLESYGEQDPPESDRWKLRTQDDAGKRRLELNEMNLLLKQVARSIGCQIKGQIPLLMVDEKGETSYICHIIASGIISNILLSQNPNPQKSLIILPGSRANLVAYKIQHDPRLRQAVDSGWRFVKYRQLRLLSKSAIISTALFEEQLSKDLLTYNAPQLRLL